MAGHDALLKPFTIKGLTIRNRIMSTSHAPGYAEHGVPGERYQLYHEEKAKGGIGLTMFGGSSSISPDSPVTAFGQVSVADDAVVPHLRTFADRVHRHGAAIMCQISHMGRRNRWDAADWLPLVAPSVTREPQHRALPKAMEDFDFTRIIGDFARAARRCRDGGLDGVEVMLAGTHLINQFFAPSLNRRTDEYGGSLDNRMRFAFAVLRAVRKEVGDDFIVGVRMSGDELVDSGLDQAEMLEIARRIAASGLVDFMNVTHAQPADAIGLAINIPNMAFPPAPFLYLASAIKAAVPLPVFHAGKIADMATAARAVEEGHVDLVAMTRAHIADPHIVRKLIEGRPEQIRQCVGANFCIDRLYFGGGALCVQNVATGREATIPHEVPKAEARRSVVIAGAGPGGLEAARVAALRGHRVVLFERDAKVGGQINVAARAGWREALGGISRWLEAEVRRLGVDLRLGAAATPALIEAERPDIVVVATGGRPNKGAFRGTENATTSWDVLTGKVPVAENVLVFDDEGQHQGASVAEFAATRGAAVEIATPDRMVAEQLGATNYAVHLRELHKLKVMMTPNVRLTEVGREGNRLVAVLRHEYSGQEEERLIDQVIAEHGTEPEDELYLALRPGSTNLGEVDYPALIAGRPQTVATNPDGRFRLFRIGDAIASRTIHNAMLDAMRHLKDA
jgi:2,4-dienoyl-CoA reductase-like NADH-dependent reductase (Old Yellow Enzyme family)